MVHVKLISPCLALAAALAACAPRPAPLSVAGQCHAELDRLGVDYAAAPVEAAAASCTVDDPVRVNAAAIAWDRPGVVACRFAVGLDDFARDAVAPLARSYFGERVTLIRHYGAYSCRTTRGGRDSQHARGEAIDIAGFVLEDGTAISVERDWRDHGPRGRFLRAVARAACERFALVLTPDSDRDHWNHIHLDDGPYRSCPVPRA